MTAPLHQAPDERCDRCAYESRGLSSSDQCICGPNVPCGWCGQGHTPDADERVGAIVGTLAEAMNRCWRDAWANKPNGPTMRSLAADVAPTVARLMAQAAEEAVVERLAGVEADIRSDLASWINLGDAKPPFAMHSAHWLVQRTYETCAGIVHRAALHPKETDR